MKEMNANALWRASLLGANANRLQGITENDLPHLGRRNLHQLVHYLRVSLLAESIDTEERTDLLFWLEQIASFITKADEKPLLPRFRAGLPNALGREGDRVWMWLGDTPGEAANWSEATIVRILKAHKREWSAGKDRGYYWRLEAHGAVSEFAFSSTEPRVFHPDDLAFLRDDANRDFTRIYCANAIRDWQPIWCLESGVEAQSDASEMMDWLCTDV